MVVLGFDLIGNPVGAIRGMADGVEDSIDKPHQVCMVILYYKHLNIQNAA